MVAADTSESKTSFDRALSFLRADDAKMTEAICEQALEDAPADGRLRCLLGVSLSRQRRHQEAVEHLQQCVSMYPEFARANVKNLATRCLRRAGWTMPWKASNARY